jgi:hypothetical protein
VSGIERSPERAEPVTAFRDRPLGAPQRGSYKDPFCKVKGGRLIVTAGGVLAAGSRVPQTDVPPDVRARGIALINRYRSKMGMGDAADDDGAAERRARGRGGSQTISAIEVISTTGWSSGVAGTRPSRRRN